MSAKFAGTTISHITRVQFRGSSSPIVRGVPRAWGVILLPCDKSDRSIELSCSFHITDMTKTEVESFQHNLCEFLAANSGEDLVVNGNIYKSVIPLSVDFVNMPQNEYFKYKISFQLDENQNFLNSSIDNTQVRSGYFQYRYWDAEQKESEFTFKVLHNWEASFSTDYDIREKGRGANQRWVPKELNGGIETVELACWVVREKCETIESYLHNYICGVGPLGKQGLLNLNGNIFENAIMVSLSQEESKGGCNGDNLGKSTLYTVEFQVSLQC